MEDYELYVTVGCIKVYLVSTNEMIDEWRIIEIIVFSPQMETDGVTYSSILIYC